MIFTRSVVSDFAIWVPYKTTSRVYHVIRFPYLILYTRFWFSKLNSLYCHLDFVSLSRRPFYEYTTGRTVSGLVVIFFQYPLPSA